MDQWTPKTYLAELSTEQVNRDSLVLDTLDGQGIARLMNGIDCQVTNAVSQAIPQIGLAIDEISKRLALGGRLFYLGAGTSGRLGVLDASECPPTFGVSHELVQGIIAGGDHALRFAVEGAEDDAGAGRQDLQDRGLNGNDAVVAISASGFAPYCKGALGYAREMGALAVSLCCNTGAALSQFADIALEAPTGAEVLSGSTRLKAGTATKMILNMLSTGVMVRLGKVYGNLMVDMRSSNQKLKDRSVRLVMNALKVERDQAEELLLKAEGNIKAAIVMHESSVSLEDARGALSRADGKVRPAIALAKSEGLPG